MDLKSIGLRGRAGSLPAVPVILLKNKKLHHRSRLIVGGGAQDIHWSVSRIQHQCSMLHILLPRDVLPNIFFWVVGAPAIIFSLSFFLVFAPIHSLARLATVKYYWCAYGHGWLLPWVSAHHLHHTFAVLTLLFPTGQLPPTLDNDILLPAQDALSIELLYVLCTCYTHRSLILTKSGSGWKSSP